MIYEIAGILLFCLNFIGLLVMNGSAEYLSLVIRYWNLYRVQGDEWKSKYNQFWKCMPFKLVMPFETEFLYVQNPKCKVDFQIDILFRERHLERHRINMNLKIVLSTTYLAQKSFSPC